MAAVAASEMAGEWFVEAEKAGTAANPPTPAEEAAPPFAGDDLDDELLFGGDVKGGDAGKDEGDDFTIPF